MANKTQTIAKPAPKTTAKPAPKTTAKTAPKTTAKPQAPAVIAAIVAWVDALPSSVTFYRNAVNHHKKQGTIFPRLPILADEELKKALEITQGRIAKSVNANGFSESKRVFDAYIVGRYGPGAIPTK